MILEKARAKINLTLDVLGTRPDGYHEVCMVMQTLDFCDFLALTARDDEEIVVRSNASFMPLDERNLAYRAASAFRQRTGQTGGVTIEIDKRIPVAAGLAGGSADAAATLRGLNALWHTGLDAEQLAKLGATVGSDVPFCVYGGTALAKGRGEVVEVLDIHPALWVVLAKPPLAVSTHDIYAAYVVEEKRPHPSVADMVAALRSGDPVRIGAASGNVLEDVTTALYPEVRRLKETMQKLGAPAVMMSGSGPTLFAVFNREQRARRMYTTLRRSLKEVFLCQTC